MGIPITVYFLLCIQSSTHYVAVLPVLTADLVVVHTCLEVVVGTLDAWTQCTWIPNLLAVNGTTWCLKQCRKGTLSAVEPVSQSTLADSFSCSQCTVCPSILYIMSSTDHITSILTLHMAHLLVFVYFI